MASTFICLYDTTCNHSVARSSFLRRDSVGGRKQITCGIVYLQADMVLTEDPVDTVIAATTDDVLAIRASKMPRMRRGEVWEPKYQ